MAGKDISLKFVTLNVQGLRKPKIRKALFRSFKISSYDVIALQETYLLESDVEVLSLEWKGHFLLTEGSNQSRGLLILFNNSISKEDITMVYKSDRIISCILSFHDKKILISNIYSPSDTLSNRRNFLDRFRDFYISFSENDDYSFDDSIVLGDFNASLKPDLDIISGNHHPASLVQKFNDTMNSLFLNDIFRIFHPQKREYTYSKKERNKPMICRRLDYVFANEELFPFINFIDIQSLGFSDHRAVVMQIDFSSFKRGSSNYKLNKSILNDLEFINLVKSEIKKLHPSISHLDPKLIWECIKAQIKSVSMVYSKSKAFSRNNLKDSLQIKLNSLEEKNAIFPGNVDTEKEIEKTKNELEIFTLADSRGAQIRAGIKFAELGERCNKFFLGMEKSRSTNNTIFKLKDGDRVFNQSDSILNFIRDYYDDLYKNPPTCNNILDDASNPFLNPAHVNVLDSDQKAGLDMQITEGELLATLKRMKDGAAPGLDGLPIEVYKVFWGDLKGYLFDCVKACFSDGSLTPSQSQGLICLLHKGGDLARENISNWRPIALLNSDYKLIAKLLAIRLYDVLDKLIHTDQHAFVKGRRISHMLRELYDIIENEKLHNSNTILLSIDYSKAFDTIKTQAILKSLQVYGFGEYFSRWIKILLSNRTCCIRNAGYISSEFPMERGVRQGCPISPILFILTSELFAASIRADKNIRGIKIGHLNIHMKIKQYADDTTFLLKDMIDFREVLSKIKMFTEFSGLKLNKKKTYAMRFGHDNWAGDFKDGILFVTKIKILGIFFSLYEDARFLSENIEGKIKSLEKLCNLWFKRRLTIIGKILILKVFGISLFVNVIQSIGITDENLTKINHILFNFIWKSKNSAQRVIHKVKWSVLCNHRSNGGLEMIDLKCFQSSFLLSWAQQLLHGEDAGWKQLAWEALKKVGSKAAFKSTVKSKYFKGLHLINNLFWKEVLCVFLDYNSYEDMHEITTEAPLFNNADITFKNKSLFFPHCIKKGIVYVKDMFMDRNLISYGTFKNIYDRADAFLVYNCIFNALKPHRNAITFVSNPIHCILYFKDIELSSIARKQFYVLIKASEIPITEKMWSRKLGSDFNKLCWTLPFQATKETRLQALQWKILMNIFPTAIVLQRMKVRNSDLCIHCDIPETIEHFFFHCAKLDRFWHYVENIISGLVSKRISLTWKDAILGITSIDGLSGQKLDLVNLVILLSKQSISKFKYGSRQDPCLILEHELIIRKILKY